MASLSSRQRAHLAERIRRLAQDRGLEGDRPIASASHLSKGWRVASIEEGAAGPSLAVLLALCRGLGLYSIDELLGFSASVFFDHLDGAEDILGAPSHQLYAELEKDPPSPPGVVGLAG